MTDKDFAPLIDEARAMIARCPGPECVYCLRWIAVVRCAEWEINDRGIGASVELTRVVLGDALPRSSWRFYVAWSDVLLSNLQHDCVRGAQLPDMVILDPDVVAHVRDTPPDPDEDTVRSLRRLFVGPPWDRIF